VQALKAGIMEIPDVIAVNKCEHPLARTTATDVRQVLALGPRETAKPPVILTDALAGIGIGRLWDAVEAHRVAGGLEERRRRNLAAEVFAVASARARRHLEAAVAEDPGLTRLLEQVERRELDPLSAVRAILHQVFHLGDENSPDTH
jgi:LAO/AO transport system kinase